jgi:hypothetical protein
MSSCLLIAKTFDLLPLATRKVLLKRLLRGCNDLVVLDGIPAKGLTLYREFSRLPSKA